ncbi:Uncharacterised protein [Mycobacteroides abscessus subsp. abscessus]|nr:Uncharacterised protein [Mycobacteroides abscessus subsp. abscessus]
MPLAIGIRTRRSLARRATSVSPGPSAPTINATFSARNGGIASASAFESPAGVMASNRKPLSRSLYKDFGHSGRRANGTSNAWPIDTRTALRYSGSAQPLPKNTASTPIPAALRKIEPRFSWSFTPSSTATVRAACSKSAAESSSGRRDAASTPRLR